MDTQAERGKWIRGLGGPVKVAAAFGLRSHSVVSNWRRKGFPERHKPALIALAEKKRVPLHPELLEHRQWYARHEPSAEALWVRKLCAAWGGTIELATAARIPRLSLYSMRKNTGIMAKHVPTLEWAAKEKRVPLPGWWPRSA